MNEEQCTRFVEALEKIEERLEGLQTSVDDLCGAIEHVTGSIIPGQGCLNVKVKP